MSRHDSIYINVNLATLSKDRKGLGVIKSAAIAQKDGSISFVGQMEELCAAPEILATEVIDLEGKWMTPGLVDCHSHIVFGGNRANEFKMRLSGASYEEIAKSGGGIVSTVEVTRSTSEDALYKSAKERVLDLIKDGVTTIEIKSGYGLDVETERKMLVVAKRLEATLPIKVSKTFLGAHTLPKEYVGRREEYIDLICNEMIPQFVEEGLIDAVDGFCESIAFSAEEIEKVFKCAAEFGLPIKLHAEQLSNSHGAELVSKYKGLSADHLEFLDEPGVMAMAASDTTAILVPGAFFMLREKKLPPIDLLRKHRVPMAVATDCNPGSSPALSLRLMLTMACQIFSLTFEEGLKAITINAARALGLESKIGSLEPGKDADMAVWDIEDIDELAYWLGGKQPLYVIKNGSSAIRGEYQ